MKTFHHTTNTRERFEPNRKSVTDRMKRRAELRKMHKVQAKGMAHDPRAVKFNFKRV